MADQYSFLFTLSLIITNVKALSFTGIALTDILNKDSFKRFLAVYNDCIVSMIEKGYTKDF